MGVDTVRMHGLHFEDVVNRYWFRKGIGIFVFFSFSSVGTWVTIVCWFNCLASLQKLSASFMIFWFLPNKITFFVHKWLYLSTNTINHTFIMGSHLEFPQKVCCKLQIAFDSSFACNSFWTQIWHHLTKLFLPGQFHWVGCVLSTRFQ